MIVNVELWILVVAVENPLGVLGILACYSYIMLRVSGQVHSSHTGKPFRSVRSGTLKLVNVETA